MADVASASPPDDLVGRGTVLAEHLERSGPEPAAVIPPDPAAHNGESPSGDASPPVDAGTAVADPPTPTEPSVSDESHAETEGVGEPEEATAAPDEPVAVEPESGTEAAVAEPSAAAVAEPEEAPKAPVDRSGVAAIDAEPSATTAATGRVLPPLPRIIAVANQKGGVGKTTTAVNLGACLADIGYRVLVVDLDPQGNASTGLGINIRGLEQSMYDVILHDVPIEDCIEASSVRNLFVAPASLDLAGAEIELVPAFSRETRLKNALNEVRDDYDYVLIDCPPSLGLLTVNGMAAAGEMLVPIQCEYYALEGLGQLLRNVSLVQKNLNPTLEVQTIVLVMYDARTKLADQVVQEVRDHFGERVCRIVIPRTVRLSEAPSFGQPIIAFDPSSRGAVAYRELAKEVSGGAPQRVG